jgi:hypothetical protein
MKRPSKRAPSAKKATAKKRAVKNVQPKKIAKGKTTKKTRAKKKALSVTGMRTTEMALGGPLGCCTIKPPGEADFHIPHITEDECRRRIRDLGAAGRWRKGECA